MSIRPGPKLIWTGCALVAVGLLCFFWRGAVWVLPVIVAGMTTLALFDCRELKRAFAAVAVARDMPVVAGRGFPFRVSLKLHNTFHVRLSAEIRDILPHEAEPRLWSQVFELHEKEINFEYQVRIPRRGLHAFGPVWLRLTGRYGFLEKQHSFDCPGEVKILPESIVTSEEFYKEVSDEMLLMHEMPRRRRRGEGTEFESISEFRQGDDARRIDWRSTARHKRLMMRRYQPEQHRDIVILLDCGRLMGTVAEDGTKLDRAVDSALMLSRVALAKGDRCGLGVFDDRIIGYLPPQSGMRAFPLIMESTYNVSSRLRETNFSLMFATLQTRQRKRSLIIVLSDIVDVDTSDRFRGALAALTRRHVVIFAALRTPLLGAEVERASTSALDVSRKAVALRLLRERERALHSLSRTGIVVLDVEPKKLTVPLVNKYLELRERNLV